MQRNHLIKNLLTFCLQVNYTKFCLLAYLKVRRNDKIDYRGILLKSTWKANRYIGRFSGVIFKWTGHLKILYSTQEGSLYLFNHVKPSDLSRVTNMYDVFKVLSRSRKNLCITALSILNKPHDKNKK